MWLKASQDPTDNIRVEIKPVSLEACKDDVPFIALSYYWGEGQEDHEVFVDSVSINMKGPAPVVDETSQSKRVYVKRNLYKALLQFRHHTIDLPFWIDAICINQADSQEKNLQIAKMPAIYSAATHVYVWLGSPDSEGRSARAMDFIPELVKQYDVDELITPANTKKWLDLLVLMRSSWFTRRWVIQELALAKDAIVHCGNKRVHWNDFSVAISLMVLRFEKIRRLFQASQDSMEEKDAITSLNPLGAKILVDEIGNMFTKNEDGSIFKPLQGLETLASTLASFSTSDPRDTINCILNIAKETYSFGPGNLLTRNDNPPPKPDYTQKLDYVYIAFVRWVVQNTGSLDIICRHWALPEVEGRNANYVERSQLPTWIKTVHGSSYGTQDEGWRGRKNGDSLVGLPGQNPYNACRGRRAKVRFGLFDNDETSTASSPSPAPSVVTEAPRRKSTTLRPLPPPLRSSLFVNGIVLDTIKWKTGTIDDGIIPTNVLSALGWGEERREMSELRSVPDKVWRTLVADRGPDGKLPPPYYPRACLKSLTNISQNFYLATKEILGRKPPPPKIVIEYLGRVQAVTWNRVVFTNTEEGVSQDDSLVGIGPSQTKTKDIICILSGCSVPCILRPTEWPDTYVFIGEAFVYGKMDGAEAHEEAFETPKTFRLI
ncbi:heterokaryon incompatibility protein-domain-containing protein [Xylariaceae sp. AK1471]|nr:heterokaryon incompatibility protein-domain-containing protein [Xylariaceae sp. AK1471]